MEAYYFQQLNKEQQHIYHAILKGVQNLENEFLVPACDRETLYDLFFGCVWIIRRFSGRLDFGINTIRIRRILSLFRSICLRKRRLSNIRKQ